MSNEIASIFVALKADASGLSSALNVAGTSMLNAERKFDRSLDIMERRSTGAFSAISGSALKASTALASFAKGGLVGALAGLSAGAIGAGIRDNASALAELATQARIAGIGVEQFQQLKFVAEQNKIGVDVLSEGLKELQNRADEYIQTMGGPGADAFKRLGYGADQLTGKLRDPVQLFGEIIGKLGELDQAAQIRVADEIFGGSAGERFLLLIQQGEDGIARTAQQARDLGVVIDRDLVERAAELDQAFQRVSATVGAGLSGAIANASWQLFNFIQQFQAFEARTNQSLDQSMRDLGMERLDLENEILQIQSEQAQNGNLNAMISESRIKDAKARLALIVEEETKILDVLESRKPIIIEPLQLDAPGLGAGGFSDFLKEVDVETKKVTASTKASSTAAGNQRDAFGDVIQMLVEEREQLGLNADQLELYRALRQAEVDLTSEAGQKVAEHVYLLQEDRRATDAATLAMERRNAQIATVLDALGSAVSGIFDGGVKSFDQFLDRVMDGFAQIGAQNIEDFFSLDSWASMGSDSNQKAGFIQAIEQGAANGTEKGSLTGVFDGFATLLGGNGNGNGQGAIGISGLASAGLGGLGIGYQAQDPMMGGLGGALSGAMAGAAGGPIGMAIGPVIGKPTSLSGLVDEAKKQKPKLELVA